MKRKYTRKVSPETVQPKSNGFTDLPLSLRKEIEHIIEYRKSLGIYDDSIERKERAVMYQEFRNKKLDI